MNTTMYHLFFSRFRRSIFKYLPGVLLVAAFSSCEKAGFTYNNVVDNNQATDYILSDTLSLTMKTIRYDSIPTSGAATLLTGIKTDPLFGTTTATSFFQLLQPATIDIPVHGSQYDSMSLIMHPNGYMSGDSTIPQDLRVYRVTEKIQPAKNFYYLYNNSSFSTETNPIGSFTGIIRPGTDKIISVKMSDILGNQLFTMLRDKSPDITASNTFLEFFKGLQVRPGPNSKAVTGFSAEDTSLTMRLYYHTNEIITTVKYVDFKMTTPELQFNQVSTNRTGTPIAALDGTEKELPSTQTGNVAFIQPITGVATRIDLPYLKSLPQLGQYFKLMKVIMTVSPANGSTIGYRLPPNLVLCAVNKTNDVTDTLNYGTLTIDNMYNEHTTYTYDITSYCTAQLTATDNTARGLLLTTSGGEARTTLDRLAIGDQRNTKNKIKIQVYFLLYK
ncbi:DUF4270 family protein [Chitinophaga sp. MM2321]|uniref:DUF4270 family protein n=1 Tax=Chitinophaga sp. MM2321 TaxID=3137178 RepID=UPI0032D5AD88